MHKENSECYYFHRCNNCLSVFLTNRINENELHDYYSENYLPYKGSSAWGKFSAFVEGSQKNLDKKRLKFVAKEAGGKRNFSLLDIGCGKPSFLQLVQQKFDAKCTGIDFSDNGWKNNSYHELDLYKTSLAAFVPKTKFDIITLWHYLEHDYHLHQTVNQLYNCLNPGGKLIIEVPDYVSVTAIMQKQFWQGWHSPRHLTLFSENGIKTLFGDEKWTVTKHLRYGTLDAFTLWWLGKMEKKRINWNDSMEREFWPLVLLKVISYPFFLFEKVIPMGIQLVVIKKK